MVGHEMPFLDLALLLASNLTKHFHEVSPQAAVQTLLPVLRYEHDMVLALPLRVA